MPMLPSVATISESFRTPISVGTQKVSGFIPKSLSDMVPNWVSGFIPNWVSETGRNTQ